jgi:hypothetical protein
VLLAAGAFGLRSAVWAAAAPVEPIGDEVYYLETSAELASGRGHRSPSYDAVAAWPPGQPFLLALLGGPPAPRQRATAPARVARLQLASTAVGALLPPLVALLGWALVGPRAGRLAGILAALDPELVAYSHYLWAESLFAVLATGGFCIAAGARSGNPARAAGAGFVLGLAALTREEGLLFALAAALWLVLGTPGARGAAVRRAGLLLAATLLVVAPWTVRNALRLHAFVPISTAGWLGMAEGNRLGASWLRPDADALADLRRHIIEYGDELASARVAREIAFEEIAAEQPAWLAKKLVRNGALLLAPDSFALKKLSRGAYGEVPLGMRRAALVGMAVSWLGVAALALAGLAAAPRGPRRLVVFAAGAVLALHVVANASSRYRFPLVPLLLPFAAAALLAPCATARALGAGGRLALVAGLLALGGATLHFAPDAASFWTDGHYLEPMRP